MTPVVGADTPALPDWKKTETSSPMVPASMAKRLGEPARLSTLMPQLLPRVVRPWISMAEPLHTTAYQRQFSTVTFSRTAVEP